MKDVRPNRLGGGAAFDGLQQRAPRPARELRLDFGHGHGGEGQLTPSANIGGQAQRVALAIAFLQNPLKESASHGSPVAITHGRPFIIPRDLSHVKTERSHAKSVQLPGQAAFNAIAKSPQICLLFWILLRGGLWQGILLLRLFTFLFNCIETLLARRPSLETSMAFSAHFDDDLYLPEQDQARFAAAETSLLAWSHLPLVDRHGPVGVSVLALSRSLLSSPQALTKLARAGFDMALDLDDPIALREFISQGANLPPLIAPAPDSPHGYSQAWDQGMAQWCARHDRINCLEELANMGRLEEERALAAPFIKEPQPSPLAQIDKAFLNQRLLGLAAEDSDDSADPGSDLILMLVRGMESESLRLSFQMSESQLRQNNPLFALLWRSRDGAAPERPFELLESLAFKHQLFEHELQSHRHAMLGAVADGSIGALHLCLTAGVSPDEPELGQHDDLALQLAQRAFRTDARSKEWMALAKRFFEPWVASTEPLIQHRVLDAIIHQLERGQAHEKSAVLNILDHLCLAWGQGETPGGMLPRPEGETTRERLDQLASKRLQAIEEARAVNEPNLSKAAKEQREREAQEKIFNRAIELLQPLSSAPRAPTRRM